MCKQLWIISMKNFMTFCLMHLNCLAPSIIQLKKIHISICGSSGWKSWHQNSSYWKLNSRDANKGELLEFVKKKKNMNVRISHYLKLGGVVEAWMDGLLIGHNSCNFGRKNLLFLQIFVVCEMGFFKQNAIKDHLWASLKLDTLDALMKISLCNIEMDIWTKRRFSRCGKTWKIIGFLFLNNCQSLNLNCTLMGTFWILNSKKRNMKNCSS
jgi:hypothetical protein